MDDALTPLPVIPGALVRRAAWVPPTPPCGPLCTAPGCGRPSAHQHHTVSRSWQRSHLGGVYDWLELNGELALIVVDLCFACHEQLESGWGGCRSRLRWLGGWAWYDRLPSGSPVTETMPASEPVRDPAPIVWCDHNWNTWWHFKGFCSGEYVLEEEPDV